ncbi:MAG TPA: hypothetical protein VFU02_19065 [Polyangiaceae bacterium]|nr:hypothetical protein [Polyangiaceae bacterium]
MTTQIPAPLPSDSDKVVNLLQNAALFDRIGDTEEALHWLRQAVECAGDGGDDARTLTLARSAAELSVSLGPASDLGADGRSGVHERRLPVPPPRSRPPEPTGAASRPAHAKPAVTPQLSDADTASEEEPVLLLKRTVPHSRPPVEARDGAEVKPLESTAPGATPAEDKAPESRSALTPPPLPSVRANGSRPPPSSVRPSPTPLRSAPPSRSSSRPAPPSMRPRITPSMGSRASSAPPQSAAVSRRSVAPVPSARTHASAPAAPAPAVARPSVRQAVRVSVERSSSDPGLLLVRVLEEGKAPDAGCTEALLVSVDANALPYTI